MPKDTQWSQGQKMNTTILTKDAGKDEEKTESKEGGQEELSREKLISENEALRKQISEWEKNEKIDVFLLREGARNPRTVRALINQDEMQDEQALLKQIEQIRNSDGYLFYARDNDGFYGQAPEESVRQDDAFLRGFRS